MVKRAGYFTVFIIIICLLPSCGRLFRKGFPEHSGEIDGIGVKQPVEIYRDAYGIPHIYAQSEYDVYFAQGYVHAQDRLSQMELSRRIAKGRLSELIGEDTVEIDMFMRLLGMDKAMERLASEASDEMKEIAGTYVDGINAYVQTNRDNMPLELSALEVVPEPFTEADVSAMILLNSWLLNRNFTEELLAVKMMNRATADAFSELFPSHPNADLPSDDYYNSFKSLKVAPFLEAVDVFEKTQKEDSGPKGSNCWVISGERSLSGKPILANDPHLGHNVPGIWYINHLVTPSSDVIGASMPNSPAVIIGHNESVSWGLTNVMTDYVDLYVVKVDPDNPEQYFVDDRVLDMDRAEITINVKDKQPEHRTIYHTIHGPVITTMEKGYDAQIALKWHGKTADATLEGFYHMNHAREVADVFKAGEYLGIVAQNLVAADSSGNIGWHITGKSPIREGYSGRLPADGSRSDFGWKAFVPYDELPSTLNPASGVIVTSNNRRIDDDYPYPISYSWAAPYRSRRIEELLNSEPRLSTEDIERIQGDHYSLQAEEFISQMAGLTPKDEDAKFALESLRSWDNMVTAESWEAAIYEVFLTSLSRNLLGDEMGEDLRYHFANIFSYSVIDNDFSNPDLRFWDKVDTSEQETREQILAESLSDAVVFLREKFGKNEKKWLWGKLHQIHYDHPGVTGWFTKHYMSAGSYPLGGDNNTINIGGFNPSSGKYDVASIASLRMIVDMKDVSKGQIIIPMGQSGQPQHKHYKDMIQPWREIEYVPLYFKKKDVVANQKELLVLRP
ncbi:penicillin acylase family protein [Candidatus Poribacteria bacterium]